MVKNITGKKADGFITEFLNEDEYIIENVKEADGEIMHIYLKGIGKNAKKYAVHINEIREDKMVENSYFEDDDDVSDMFVDMIEAVEKIYNLNVEEITSYLPQTIFAQQKIKKVKYKENRMSVLQLLVFAKTFGISLDSIMDNKNVFSDFFENYKKLIADLFVKK